MVDPIICLGFEDESDLPSVTLLPSILYHVLPIRIGPGFPSGTSNVYIVLLKCQSMVMMQRRPTRNENDMHT